MSESEYHVLQFRIKDGKRQMRGAWPEHILIPGQIIKEANPVALDYDRQTIMFQADDGSAEYALKERNARTGYWKADLLTAEVNG